MENSTSREIPRRENFHHERREDIYTKVEHKIGLVKDIWAEAKRLPIPSKNDTEETSQTERNQFQAIFDRSLTELPQAAAKYKRYKEIEAELQRSRQKPNQEKESQDDVRDNLLWEQSNLLKDGDLRFLVSLNSGIEGALEKRRVIRSVLPDIEDSLNPASYDKYLPERFRGLAQKVIKERFSITLAIDMSRWPYSIFKGGSGISGFHKSDSIWNLVENISAEGKKRFKRVLGGELFRKIDFTTTEEISAHEDFHSFTEGFDPGYQKDADLAQRLEKRFERLKRLKELDAPEIILQEERQLVKNSLWDYTDNHHLELLAEMASRPFWEDRPRETAAVQSFEKAEKLKSLKGVDQNVDGVISLALKFLNMKRLANTLKGWRQKLKLEMEAPERIEDLEIALALFPPSKIHHIEKLVRHWTAKTDGSPKQIDNLGSK